MALRRERRRNSRGSVFGGSRHGWESFLEDPLRSNYFWLSHRKNTNKRHRKGFWAGWFDSGIVEEIGLNISESEFSMGAKSNYCANYFSPFFRFDLSTSLFVMFICNVSVMSFGLFL